MRRFSLKKSHWRALGAIFWACLGIGVPARAQFTGFSIPQVLTFTAFSGTACSGVEQTALIANLGQTEHFATVTTSGVLAFRMTVKGSHDGVIFNDISDVATSNNNTVMGQGYYPVVEISITCASAAGTFSVRYSGQATAPAMQIAALQSAQIDKSIANAVPAGANFTSQTVRAPFGNSAGALLFQYSAAGPSGSVLTINCGSILFSSPPSQTVVSFPLGTGTATQYFTVPMFACDFINVAYTSGGASAATFSLSYLFNSAASTGGDPCQGSTAAKASVAINQTATTKLVTELTGHAVFVCGFSFTLSGSATATAQFISGTGAACATGTVNLSGAFVTVPPLLIRSAGGGYQITKTAIAQGLCLALAGTTPSAQGILTYVQQ